jgi:hypothetical protein
VAVEAPARVDPLLEADPADLLLEADQAEHLELDPEVQVVQVDRRLQAVVEDRVDQAERLVVVPEALLAAAVVRPRTRSSILRMARSRTQRKLARNPTI